MSRIESDPFFGWTHSEYVAYQVTESSQEFSQEDPMLSQASLLADREEEEMEAMLVV